MKKDLPGTTSGRWPSYARGSGRRPRHSGSEQLWAFGAEAQVYAGAAFLRRRAYVLTRVDHLAKQVNAYRSNGDKGLEYKNHCTCIPFALPYRPPPLTPKPTVAGPQTATVVGPPGERNFTDKYGRAKVQFHWDRQGKHNPDSACWLRVSSVGAGKGFGFINLPRVGQEVIVDFSRGIPTGP